MIYSFYSRVKHFFERIVLNAKKSHQKEGSTDFKMADRSRASIVEKGEKSKIGKLRLRVVNISNAESGCLFSGVA